MSEPEWSCCRPRFEDGILIHIPGGRRIAKLGHSDQGRKDAQLICTAVNCHAKLLGALKQAHSALVGSHAADDSVQGEARARAWSAIKEAEEMLNGKDGGR